MKKLLNVLITLFLLIIPVSADEESGGGLSEDSLSTEIYLDLNEYSNGTENYATRFSWSVPSSVSFNNSYEDIATGTVSVRNNSQGILQKISLGTNENKISSSEGAIREFEIYKDDKELKNGDVIYLLGTTNSSLEITFKLLPSSEIYSGTYTGIVNFVATINTCSGGAC